MLIQGNLKIVFDALLRMGIVDSVLKIDWEFLMEEKNKNPHKLEKIIEVVNSFQGSVDHLVQHLSQFEPHSLELLSMEVAREYADYQSRSILH